MTELRRNQKISPRHPVFGEGYRMLDDDDVLQEGDQTACVSMLLGYDGDRWVEVTAEDFPNDLGKTIGWYREESSDADRWDRVFRRVR